MCMQGGAGAVRACASLLALSEWAAFLTSRETHPAATDLIGLRFQMLTGCQVHADVHCSCCSLLLCIYIQPQLAAQITRVHAGVRAGHVRCREEHRAHRAEASHLGSK